MTVTISKHAQETMAKRGIDSLMISAAIYFGEKIRGQNSLYFFLGRRALKKISRVFSPSNPEKWEGVVVVCDPLGEILITCFKNKHWPKKIRHKK